jgi:hypothetical protein
MDTEESAKISRKPSRRECRCSAVTCGEYACVLSLFRTQGCGCKQSARHSLRPHYLWAQRHRITRAQTCRGNAKTRPPSSFRGAHQREPGFHNHRPSFGEGRLVPDSTERFRGMDSGLATSSRPGMTMGCFKFESETWHLLALRHALTPLSCRRSVRLPSRASPACG